MFWDENPVSKPVNVRPSGTEMAEVGEPSFSDDFFSCSLCFDKYDDPRALPCQHTFCLKCLRDYITARKTTATFPCPLCQTKTKIPGRQVDKLPPNFTIKQMMERVEGENVEHANYCKDCNMWMSKLLTNAHKQFPSTRNHDVLNNETMNSEYKTQAELKRHELGKPKDELDFEINYLKMEKCRIEKECLDVKNDIKSKVTVLYRMFYDQVERLTGEVDTFYKEARDKVQHSLTKVKERKSTFENAFKFLEDIKNSQDGQTSEALMQTVTEMLAQTAGGRDGQTTPKLEKNMMVFNSGVTEINFGNLTVTQNLHVNIKVETVAHGTFILGVQLTDTANDVSALMAQILQTMVSQELDNDEPQRKRRRVQPVDTLHLTFGGKPMRGCEILANYEIKENSVLKLAVSEISDHSDSKDKLQLVDDSENEPLLVGDSENKPLLVVDGGDEPLLLVDSENEPLLVVENNENEPLLVVDDNKNEPLLVVENNENEPLLVVENNENEPLLVDGNENEPLLVVDSSEDQPLPMLKDPTPPDNSEISAVVHELLKGADLETVTMKTVVQQVYARYPQFDLKDRKDFIKDAVRLIINSPSAF